MDNINEIKDVLRGNVAAVGDDLDGVSAEWAAAGFSAREVGEWVDAYIMYPNDARELADAGVSADSPYLQEPCPEYPRISWGRYITQHDVCVSTFLLWLAIP